MREAFWAFSLPVFLGPVGFAQTILPFASRMLSGQTVLRYQGSGLCGFMLTSSSAVRASAWPSSAPPTWPGRPAWHRGPRWPIGASAAPRTGRADRRGSGAPRCGCGCSRPGGQGDKETRGQGERIPCPVACVCSVSPCLLVSLSLSSPVPPGDLQADQSCREAVINLPIDLLSQAQGLRPLGQAVKAQAGPVPSSSVLHGCSSGSRPTPARPGRR